MNNPFSFYRFRFLTEVAKTCVLPSLTLGLALRAVHVSCGPLTVPLYVAFTVACWRAQLWYDEIRKAQDAKRLGARLIPHAVGKWPGNFDLLMKLGHATHNKYIGAFYMDLFEEYQCTTLNLRLLWQDLIISMDEEHIKFIFATGFDKFWRGKGQKERMEGFLGGGIFNRDDEPWKAHRALARPFFARDRVTDFHTFERYTASTVDLIASLTASNEPVEVQDMYARFTLDAASEFLFGKNMDTLSGELPVPGKSKMSAKGTAVDDGFGSFAQAFEEVQAIIVARGRRGDWWPALELTGDKVAPHMKVIHEWLHPIVQQMIAQKIELQEAGIKNEREQSTFLEYLVDHTQDPKVIQDQLLNILIASRDTTACLLTFATYFMAEHPDVARKLRAEVLEYCGVDGPPTFQNIKAMRYMRAVINETLRLFHPVYLNVRESRDQPCLLPPSDCTHEGPAERMYIPPNTRFIVFPGLTQRNPAHWGADAHVFDPERWLDERLAKFTANPMMYTPFSAGPRICIGQNYALNEASCFLVRLMQRFDRFTLAPEVQPEGSMPPPDWKEDRGRAPIEKCWPGIALTTYVKGGLWVRFHEADSE